MGSSREKSILINGFFILFISTYPNRLHASCDIFFYNKCPLPPVSIQINIEEFCRDAKKHVDCVNRRLENCTEVQEYGPALETLKLTFKVYLTQASSHGCNGLYDQIRLPRRLPRTRRSTTRKPRRRKAKKRRTTSSVEYHCRKRIVRESCGLWNRSLLTINRTICHEAFQYVKCLAPLKLRCQNLFSRNEHLAEIPTYLHLCYKKYLPQTSKNDVDLLRSSSHWILLSLWTYLLIQEEFAPFMVLLRF